MHCMPFLIDPKHFYYTVYGIGHLYEHIYE